MEINNRSKNILTLNEVTVNLRCRICKKDIDGNFLVIFHEVFNEAKSKMEFENLNNHVAHLFCYHKMIYETKWDFGKNES